MKKILLVLALPFLSSASVAEVTGFCEPGTTAVGYYELSHQKREIFCFVDTNPHGIITEQLMPRPTGLNWASIDYKRGYSYGEGQYASVCYIKNGDPKSCAFLQYS
jgi:hypothetical protein